MPGFEPALYLKGKHTQIVTGRMAHIGRIRFLLVTIASIRVSVFPVQLCMSISECVT